jgi:hypothetical protein
VVVVKVALVRADKSMVAVVAVADHPLQLTIVMLYRPCSEEAFMRCRATRGFWEGRGEGGVVGGVG